ncbi:hypothetical protein MEO40_13225 [Dolichospermum sp. ST_sed1]|nr:hypothetical protein [Dolichospermum sp. ST_sed1]
MATPRRLSANLTMTKLLAICPQSKYLISHLPHPKLSHNEKWSFGDLGLFKNPKLPIVTPGGAECGLYAIFDLVAKNTATQLTSP